MFVAEIKSEPSKTQIKKFESFLNDKKLKNVVFDLEKIKQECKQINLQLEKIGNFSEKDVETLAKSKDALLSLTAQCFANVSSENKPHDNLCELMGIIRTLIVIYYLLNKLCPDQANSHWYHFIVALLSVQRSGIEGAKYLRANSYCLFNIMFDEILLKFNLQLTLQTLGGKSYKWSAWLNCFKIYVALNNYAAALETIALMPERTYKQRLQKEQRELSEKVTDCKQRVKKFYDKKIEFAGLSQLMELYYSTNNYPEALPILEAALLNSDKETINKMAFFVGYICYKFGDVTQAKHAFKPLVRHGVNAVVEFILDEPVILKNLKNDIELLYKKCNLKVPEPCITEGSILDLTKLLRSSFSEIELCEELCDQILALGVKKTISSAPENLADKKPKKKKKKKTKKNKAQTQIKQEIEQVSPAEPVALVSMEKALALRVVATEDKEMTSVSEASEIKSKTEIRNENEKEAEPAAIHVQQSFIIKEKLEEAPLRTAIPLNTLRMIRKSYIDPDGAIVPYDGMRLAITLDKNTSYFIQQLWAQNHEVCIFGGFIRDYLLGRPIHDVDFLSTATTEQINALFPKHCEIRGQSKKSARVCFEGSPPFDFCSLDMSGGVNLIQALKRDSDKKDIPWNALIWNPRTQRLYDFHGGILDLQSNLLRLIGVPEVRLCADPVLALRCLRFSQKLQITIVPKLRFALAHSDVHLFKIGEDELVNEMNKWKEHFQGEIIIEHLQTFNLLDPIKTRLPYFLTGLQNGFSYQPKL